MCLPRKEHEILQLLYEKSISWNEVAKALQIALQTVKRRRKHALNMIHSMYHSNLDVHELINKNWIKADK
jgi:DNA-directed RNA polymerase specialized sigma subunit